MIDNYGQISAEFLFLFGVLIMIVMLSIVFVADENEPNIAMAAARNGAIEGAHESSMSIYPSDTYKDYSNSKTSLLYPYSVEIINVSYSQLRYDARYEKTWIQFKVYAKTSEGLTVENRYQSETE